MTATKDPVAAATTLMADWTDAVVAAETSALSLLKVEMEGLAVLFGGEAAPKSEAALRAEDEAEEASFDNMPV